MGPLEELFEKAEGQNESWAGREVGTAGSVPGAASGDLWVSGRLVPGMTLGAGEDTKRYLNFFFWPFGNLVWLDLRNQFRSY